MPNPAKDVGGYFEGISEEEIKYDTFSAGKKLAVNVNGEVKLHYLAVAQNVYRTTLVYPYKCVICEA